MIPLVIIAGPTASGKTDFSVSLAGDIGGEIISADSMQVYKGFDIGTAKIRKDEMRGIRHYLIDEVDGSFDFNVFEFKKRAKTCIEEISGKGKIPIITGGTGFYIQSVLYDIDFEDEKDDEIRKELTGIYNEKGAEFLHGMLKEIDPESAAVIHPNNVKRVIRAIEFYRENGSRISGHNALQREKKSPYNFAFFVLNRDRQTLYERINKRVDLMLEAGLEKEVQNLLSSGIPQNALSMQGLGYKELVDYFNGNCSYEEAVEQIKKGSRHFAKRQLTWFKREKDIIRVDIDSFKSDAEALTYMKNVLKEKKIV